MVVNCIPMALLTDRKENFVQHWFTHRSGPDAYRHAYQVRAETTDSSVSSAASNLLARPEIQERIEELQRAADAQSPGVFDAAAALEAWLQIATADPDELIGLRVGCCRYCHGDDFGYQWKEREYLAALDEYERQARICEGNSKALAALVMPDVGGGFGFRKGRLPNPECPECEGEGVERVVPRDTSKLSPGAKALYGGVKKKKDGLEVIIADRQKALENATRMIGAFNDRVRLDGSIGAMLAVVKLEGLDPMAAGRKYQELIAANAA